MKVTLDTLIVESEECNQFKYEYRCLITSPSLFDNLKLQLVRDGWNIERNSQLNELESATVGRFFVTCRRLRQVQGS